MGHVSLVEERHGLSSALSRKVSPAERRVLVFPNSTRSALNGDHRRLGNERTQLLRVNCIERADGDIAHLAALPLQLCLVAEQYAILEAEPHLVGEGRHEVASSRALSSIAVGWSRWPLGNRWACLPRLSSTIAACASNCMSDCTKWPLPSSRA